MWHKKEPFFKGPSDKTRITDMKKITIEILEIITGTILLFGGLGVVLNFSDGRLLIGFVMIAVGCLVWTHFSRVVIIRKGRYE